MAEVDKRYESIIKKLNQRGHKLTPQRMAIARILALSNGHPNIETIHSKLRSDFPTMSLATVYRNVMLFKSLGEVLELGFPDGSNRYDGKKPYPHPHVICNACKKIIDPDIKTIRDLTQEVAHQTGFEIKTHRLDFFGLCRECRDVLKGEHHGGKAI